MIFYLAILNQSIEYMLFIYFFLFITRSSIYTLHRWTCQGVISSDSLVNYRILCTHIQNILRCMLIIFSLFWLILASSNVSPRQQVSLRKDLTYGGQSIGQTGLSAHDKRAPFLFSRCGRLPSNRVSPHDCPAVAKRAVTWLLRSTNTQFLHGPSQTFQAEAKAAALKIMLSTC